MTVYELIQELARYDADAKIGVKLFEAEEMRECAIERIDTQWNDKWNVWLECDLHQ